MASWGIEFAVNRCYYQVFGRGLNTVNQNLNLNVEIFNFTAHIYELFQATVINIEKFKDSFIT